MNPLLPLAATVGLAIYAWIRLGYVAPRSKQALAEALGDPSRIERLLLPAAVVLLALCTIYVAFAAIPEWP